MAKSKTLYSISGRLGVTAGMDTDSWDSVEESASGNPAEHYWTVDLSHLLSEQLGKQMPMMATYRVKGMQIGLRNVDDLNDNNYGLVCGGRINWYSPTKHRVDALQHARTFKRKVAATHSIDLKTDPFGMWNDEKMYTGMRFNFNSQDDEVDGALDDDTIIMAGSEFSLQEIFDHYNKAISGTPAGEGYESAGGAGDALWNTRTGVQEFDTLYWNAYYRNSAYDDGSTLDNAFLFQPESGGFEYQTGANNHLAVLGGLLRVSFAHTNTDNPRLGDVNDNYYLQCSIQVEGWEEF